MFYRKLLDGYYSGKKTEYVGEFSFSGSFTLYENGELLINLDNAAQLNKHYTDPSVMGYYNLATQLITEGEHEERSFSNASTHKN